MPAANAPAQKPAETAAAAAEAPVETMAVAAEAAQAVELGEPPHAAETGGGPPQLAEAATPPPAVALAEALAEASSAHGGERHMAPLADAQSYGSAEIWRMLKEKGGMLCEGRARSASTAARFTAGRSAWARPRSLA
ncbi:unnamed protein product, partial [Closterium sp. Naga37s-1]